MRRPTVVVFDVNETLLDLRSLAPAFGEAFGDERTLGEWFARTLHGSLVASTLRVPESFDVIARSALDALADARGSGLSQTARTDMLAGLRRLPAHGDVRGALEVLGRAGFPMAALTNSPRELAFEQLEHAGIVASFDPILSVEATGRFKPHAETYLAAARTIGVPVGRIRMVAAHDWDVAGALGAGARGAFVERAAASYRDWLPRPDIEASDLGAVARAIVELDSPSQS